MQTFVGDSVKAKKPQGNKKKSTQYTTDGKERSQKKKKNGKARERK
jgi:hypothetical protein